MNEATLSHAQHLMEEEKDEVKTMNAMVHYAQVMAIRDRQRQVRGTKRRRGGWLEGLEADTRLVTALAQSPVPAQCSPPLQP